MQYLIRISLALCILAAGLTLPRGAFAHSPTFAVFSKYEATTSGRSVAFVFALDKAAILDLLEREEVHAKVEPEQIEAHRAFFSQYLFARFTLANNGVPCVHPPELGVFRWDEATKRVLAVTKFTCDADLEILAIKALLTHDMPISHELVGDVKHGPALVRNFFAGDETEAEISLPKLLSAGEAAATVTRHRRGRVSYVAVPDRRRRYEDLAYAELGAAAPASGSSAPDPRDESKLATFGRFIGEGVRHIFGGYDHVLFIVTLIFAVTSWRRLAVIVTSFTVAHSISLALATLGLVNVSSALVEPLIAASVLYVAVDAVVRPHASARAAVTFGFGLLHGLGLSSVLRDLGLSGRELVPALLGFNVGVEVGQLLIVAPLFPLVLLLRKREATYARARSVLCGTVAVIAVFWIVVRVWEAFHA